MSRKKISRVRGIFITALFVFLLPAVAFSAGISIVEIMYDLEGSDTKREWAEIENTGTESVDLTGWKFFESGTNHGLVLESGSETLPPGGFAVIADDTTTFLSDWPGFSGTLFDSSFSLSNTGETLTIRNAELLDIDSVTYSSEQGAAGDGNSLQRVLGVFVPGTPTPGSANSPSQEGGETTPPPPPPPSGGGLPLFEETGSISVDAGRDRYVIVGADSHFEGEAFGVLNEPLKDARYLWSFGDGSTAEGKSVLHRYHHPGVYAAVLDVSSGPYSSSDSIRVTAEPSPLKVSSVKRGVAGFVEIENSSERDIDISFWFIRSGGVDFLVPKNTIILSKKKILFPSEVTELVSPFGDVSLLYPNGREAHKFGKDAVTIVPAQKNNSLAQPTPPQPSGQKFSQNEEVENKDALSEAGNAPFAAVSAFYDEDGNEGEGGLFKWLAALFGVIALSVAAIFMVRGDMAGRQKMAIQGGKMAAPDDIKRIADEIEIIDESDNF